MENQLLVSELLAFLKNHENEYFTMPRLMRLFGKTTPQIRAALDVLKFDPNVKQSSQRYIGYTSGGEKTLPRAAKAFTPYTPPEGFADRVREVYPENFSFKSASHAFGGESADEIEG